MTIGVPALRWNPDFFWISTDFITKTVAKAYPIIRNESLS